MCQPALPSVTPLPALPFAAWLFLPLPRRVLSALGCTQLPPGSLCALTELRAEWQQAGTQPALAGVRERTHPHVSACPLPLVAGRHSLSIPKEGHLQPGGCCWPAQGVSGLPVGHPGTWVPCYWGAAWQHRAPRPIPGPQEAGPNPWHPEGDQPSAHTKRLLAMKSVNPGWICCLLMERGSRLSGKGEMPSRGTGWEDGLSLAEAP